ncbi:dihydrofolate reductase [Specibacter cremeus]|uniref:dihydrofolate reductase n=1 Tax=Specibacter cremeus TaxID=1629051 RepID=UPI000F78359C|nr:dihydrofolate reductase [Specibacter cremeus]
MSAEGLPRPVPFIGMIWAQTTDGVIGRDGGMPWHLPEDLAHFKRTTAGHPVVMGRKTWDSFPARFRPLPDRTNIVVTAQPGWAGTPEAGGAVVVHSVPQALEEARRSPGAEEIWVIGGGQVFGQVLAQATVAVVTVINTDVPGDTQAPPLGPGWSLRDAAPADGWHTSGNGTEYRIVTWARDDLAAG